MTNPDDAVKAFDEGVEFTGERLMIQPQPTDMVIIHVPDGATADNCARIATICENLQTRYNCGVELQRRCKVQFVKTNWRDDLPLLLPKPGIIIDGGAGTGETATIYREIFPEAVIYSFEPVVASWEALSANFKDDEHVVPVRCALGRENGTQTMNVARDPLCSSFLGHEPTAPFAIKSEPIATEEVPVCRLDSWLSEQGIDPMDVGILKMDLQGGELAAIEGATQLLQVVPYVFTEVMFELLYANAPLHEDVDAAMTQRGYRCRAYYMSARPLMWADALYERAD